MLKLLKGIYSFAQLVSLWLVGLLLGAVAVNAIVLEKRYMSKYEKMFNEMKDDFNFRMLQMDYEHERQMAVGNVLRSQREWEKTAAALVDSYEREKELRLNSESDQEKLRHEMYSFMKMLERIHPGAVREVEVALGPFDRLIPEKPDGQPKNPFIKGPAQPERPLVPFEDRGPDEGS